VENITCDVILDAPITSSTYLVSASQREFDHSRSTTEFLEKRFKKNRFKVLWPWSFSKLPSIAKVQPKGGMAFFIKVDFEKNCLNSHGQIKIGYDKIQYCKVVGEILWVLGVDTLASYEVGNLEIGTAQILKPKTFIQNNLLAGAHVFHIEKDSLYVTSSGCEGVLVFSTTDGKLLRKYLFKGYKFTRSYRLPRNLDLRENYITNDFQKFHLNSCTKLNEKIFFTTLSGLVGYFHVDTGESTVIAKGHVGLHHIKYNPLNDHLHMIKSTTGTFLCMDTEGKVLQQHQIDSRWVQSAISWEKCNEIIYLDTLNNQLVLESQENGEKVLTEFSMREKNTAGPMFISKAKV
jgi:hypothetical protein